MSLSIVYEQSKKETYELPVLLKFKHTSEDHESESHSTKKVGEIYWVVIRPQVHANPTRESRIV